MSSHTDEHEVAIVSYAGGDDTAVGALAWQTARCQTCFTFAFRLMEQASVLQAVARAKLGVNVTDESRAMARLDSLLDDVMVLVANADAAPDNAAEGTERESETQSHSKHRSR